MRRPSAPPRLSMRLLSGIALGVTWTGISGMLFLRFNERKKILTSDYYRTSLALLSAFEPAKTALGVPIVPGPLDVLMNEGVHVTPFTARFTLPLNGKQRKGTLYSWSSRGDVGEGWRVERLDLEVEGTRDRFPVYRDNSRFPRAQMADPRLQNKPQAEEDYRMVYVDQKGNIKDLEEDC